MLEKRWGPGVLQACDEVAKASISMAFNLVSDFVPDDSSIVERRCANIPLLRNRSIPPLSMVDLPFLDVRLMMVPPWTSRIRLPMILRSM